MKAVMLAAGKGERMHPLTAARPKPLIEVANQSILEFNMEALKGLVDELVLVIGHKGGMVGEFLEKKDYGYRMVFVEQKEQLGTADALLKAKDLLKGRFLVLMGDDLYLREDMENCLEKERAVLVGKVEKPEDFGICLHDRGRLEKIVEKPLNYSGLKAGGSTVTDLHPISGVNPGAFQRDGVKPESDLLVNAGLYVLDDSIFGFIGKTRKSKRGELELTDAVNRFCKEKEVSIVKAKFWLPVGYLWDILEANKRLLEGLEEAVEEGAVEEGAVIKGPLSVGKGTVIKSGAYIEGPVLIGENCQIGPNCYIRPSTTIGDNCRIGNGVEVKNCVIGDRVRICHLSYFGDSIIGDNVNIGAGTIAANLRNDGENVRTAVKGRLADTGRKKFGTVIGDGVKTGINTSIYPGRKIWPGKTTLPGEVVKRDVV